MFGKDEDEDDVTPLDKLEQISRVLGTVPASVNPQVRVYPTFMSSLANVLSIGVLPVHNTSCPLNSPPIRTFATTKSPVT